MQKRPVFYFTRFLLDYRVPVLEGLNEKLDGRLVVCSGNPPRSSSMNSLILDQSVNFCKVSLRNCWLRGETLHAQQFLPAFREFGSPGAMLIEESPRSVSLPFLLAYARKLKAGRLLWGHFSSNHREFSTKNFTDRYRIALARSVEGCVCYTDGIADLLSPFVPRERLFIARNTLDTNTLFALHAKLVEEGRRNVRIRLGLPTEAPVLVFIGRLVKTKGTRKLIEVFGALQQSAKDAQLIIIGDGPEREPMEKRVAVDEIKGVHFLGAIPSWSKSAPYLFTADVMLNPGSLGLSVNHAFAFGLPIISQRAPDRRIRFHGPEAEYVKDGDNGFLVNGDSVKAFLRAIEIILSQRNRFSRSAYEYCQTYLTIQRMVDSLCDAIDAVEP